MFCKHEDKEKREESKRIEEEEIKKEMSLVLRENECEYAEK